MATRKPKPAYIPDVEYAFTVMRKVRLGMTLFKPSEGHTALGVVLNEIVAQEGVDVIASAQS